MLKNRYIVCPKCGKRGFPTVRWTQSSYFPQYASVHVMRYHNAIRNSSYFQDQRNESYLNYHKQKVTGKKYRGPSKKHLLSQETEFDKSECFRVRTTKKFYIYIGHYDKDLYKKQKKECQQGIRKSKPTGRRWCKLPKEFGRCTPYQKEISLRKIENLENYIIDRYGKIT